MISVILKVASYTYGPILGLFSFGILLKRNVTDKFVPFICLAAPLICFLIDYNQDSLLMGFKLGPELLIINGLITFLGLLIVSKPQTVKVID
jgi:hypothetical protein